MGFPVVHNVALGEQHELIDFLVKTAGGLMDGGDDGPAAAGQGAEGVDELQGCGTVQSGGGLRAKQQTGPE